MQKRVEPLDKSTKKLGHGVKSLSNVRIFQGEESVQILCLIPMSLWNAQETRFDDLPANWELA